MDQISSITVGLGDRSYPIYISEGLLESADYLAPHVRSNQLFIVTNESIAPIYLPIVRRLLKTLRPDAKVVSFELKDGEAEKNLGSISKLIDSLMEERFNRTATIIALGGGVVGDMAGFTAACFQRGVPFIQIPTTLLAQVDSSVGGKTGVNHPLGKNMIGAFYQPEAVLIDTSVLKTLPPKEFSAGIAEVIKYGLIADGEFFLWLEKNISPLMDLDGDALNFAIRRSCEIKAEVVSKDERESGIRAILNLGHTYGHAIETQMGYGSWLHGEAVAVGMVMAADLSVRLGWLDKSVHTRLVSLLERSNLPTKPPKGMNGASFLDHMMVDKKVVDGSLRLVLLRALGEAIVTSEFDPDVFQQQLESL